MPNDPTLLKEAIEYFSDPDRCLNFLVARRWPEGVTCPTCGSKDVTFIASRQMWECKRRHARKQFSIKVGTIFENSPISLDKWLSTLWMVTICDSGVSSYDVHRALGVTQKTAWYMLQRIRLAMTEESNPPHRRQRETALKAS